MSLNNINWRAEALEFSTKHNSNREMVLQMVELAMRRGAELAVIETIALVQIANVNLKKKRDASAPHREIKKTIEV